MRRLLPPGPTDNCPGKIPIVDLSAINRGQVYLAMTIIDYMYCADQDRVWSLLKSFGPSKLPEPQGRHRILPFGRGLTLEWLPPTMQDLVNKLEEWCVRDQTLLVALEEQWIDDLG